LTEVHPKHLNQHLQSALHHRNIC